MKDFQLQLNYTPRGVYFPGMTVTGTVLAVNDEPKNYKAIQVKIVGFAHVHWTDRESQNDYTSHEDYLDTSVRVWDKYTSAGGGQFPVGSYQFPFSLQLVGNNLPASYDGTVGRIKYTIEARVIQGMLKRDTVCEAVINVANVVEINRPDLLQPKSMEEEKTLCCLCCASGPIVITTRTPRTGYCILQDGIPVEVSVENGSSREVRQIVASIHKLVHYTAQGHHRYDRLYDIATIASEPVPAHNTTVWQPPPLAVPATPATLINCGILQVNYYLQVKVAISWAVNPTIDIPLVLGNVPLQGTEASSQPTMPPQQGLEPLPSLGLMAPPQSQPGGILYAMPHPPPASIPLDPFPPPYDDPPHYDDKSSLLALLTQ